jgi:hypothetical protein
VRFARTITLGTGKPARRVKSAPNRSNLPLDPREAMHNELHPTDLCEGRVATIPLPLSDVSRKYASPPPDLCARKSLACALVFLGDPGLSRADREHATKTVLSSVGAWALPHFRRRFRRRLAFFAADEVDELLRHALEDAVLAAMKGRFRGGNDRSAHAWCGTVIRHRLLTHLRRTPRCEEIRVVPLEEIGTDPPCDQDTAPGGWAAVQRLILLLREEIGRACRQRDRSSVLRSFDTFCGGKLGAATRREQAGAGLEGLADDSRETPTVDAARACIYQGRRRGRMRAERALLVLANSPVWDRDLAEASRLLGLSTPPSRDLAEDCGRGG